MYIYIYVYMYICILSPQTGSHGGPPLGNERAHLATRGRIGIGASRSTWNTRSNPAVRVALLAKQDEETDDQEEEEEEEEEHR